MITPNRIEIEPELLQVIEVLAEEIDCPVEEVSNIYISALKSLESKARIQDFLNVLASKKARDELRQRHAESHHPEKDHAVSGAPPIA